MIKKALIFVLTFTLALCIASFALPEVSGTANAASRNAETKSFCTATVDEDFAEDRVIVTLNMSASRGFKTYTAMDFADVACKNVSVLNSYSADIAKKKLSGEISKSNNTLSKVEDVNVDTFRTTLLLALNTEDKQGVLDAIKQLEKRDDVLCVEPDYRMTYFADPSPTPTYYSGQWGISKIQLPQAWDYTTGSEAVVVGMIDSGMEGAIPDLANRIATGLCGDFTSGSSVVSTPTDGNGHGTWVAGIIGAQRDVGISILTGVAQNVRLASLKCSDPGVWTANEVSTYVSSAIRALQFAKQNDIPIINNSGGYPATNGSTSLDTALKNSIEDYGGLFVCAAGNFDDNRLVLPACFDLDNIISVGATTREDTIWRNSAAQEGSSWHETHLDLFAPGHEIYGTSRNQGVAVYSGTCGSAPFVSGVAALLLSIDPTLTPTQLKAAIMNNVDRASSLGTSGLASLYNKCVSKGRLNAFRAVSSIYNTKYAPFTATAAEGYATITGIKDDFASLRSIAIPSIVNIDGTNYPVREIDECAFADNTLLKNVYIPDSVTYIGDYAFGGCTNLESVSIDGYRQKNLISDHSTSYTNYYYTERSLGVRLQPNATYTLKFTYKNLSTTTAEYTDVFTSLGVGETTFAVDLPVQKTFSGLSGTQTIVFTPTAAQLASSNNLWCRFIRTSTPQSVSVDISNVSIQKSATNIEQNAFYDCPKLASDGLDFTLIDNGTHYSVSGADADCYVLFIPSSFNGKTVTKIANNGFEDYSNRWLFLQEGLQMIGDFAFAQQNNLEKVTIPSSVTSIENFAFIDCPALTNVYFEEEYSITNIGGAAFCCCEKLTTITIPSTVTNIGSYAFFYCEKLGPVLFDNYSELTTIGYGAFQSCSLLYQLDIPASVTSIGIDAFKDCTFLTSVNFESGSALTSIGNSAFYGCDSLTNIDIPSGLTSIGYNAFNGTNLLSITIPSTVDTIGSNAFLNCSKLTIYTSKTAIPSGWSSDWNSSNRPVFLSCTFAGNPDYVVSFAKSATNPSNTSATNGIKEPYRDGYNFGGWYTASDFSGSSYSDPTAAPNGTLYAKWTKKSCVAEGTMITLADGSQVAVENLTGIENLLVWNMLTGQFDSAPILFIDSDPYRSYEIIHLYFSDGTEVKVIDEHGFWDFDLNEYVFLREDAAQYIGHWFNKQTLDNNGNMIWTAVQLIDVDVYDQNTTAWSPVTYGHLCYYVNGMLSMPGATEGFINIFEVNSTNMAYDSEAMAEDIATYGLFTYEEFAELVPIPEEIFNAFCGQYLKVSLGKGLIDMNSIAALIERYSAFF